MDRPIPALYCCYLLRSTVRHSSLYVGSTPHPARRLAQHNGRVKGGAARTARDTLRPWEMACLVTGFPSSIAALQFEWAWQNPHLTRRIAEHERINAMETRVKISKKTGKPRKRPVRPRASLSDKILNLSLLLRVPSFSRMPLELRFYSDDVYRAWQKYSEVQSDIKGRSTNVESQCSQGGPSRLDIKVHPPSPGANVEDIDHTYLQLKPYIAKSQLLLEEQNVLRCCVCRGPARPTKQMVLVCSNEHCCATSHVVCLSDVFLQAEKGTGSTSGSGDIHHVVPVSGNCPECKTHLVWSDMVKEMSLRVRGEKEIAKVMRKKRKRGVDANDGTDESVVAASEDAGSEGQREYDYYDDDDEEEEGMEDLSAADVVDEPLKDQAEQEGNDEDEEASSRASSEPETFPSGHAREPTNPTFKYPRSLDIVIEDSESDGVEIIG